MSKTSFIILEKEYFFSDITLRRYYELQRILSNPVEGCEYDIVTALTDCPKDILMKLKYSVWLEIWEEAQLELMALTDTKTENVKPIIELDGVKYALVDINDLTLGEFVDLDLVLQSTNAETKLNQIAAIVYRPLVKTTKNSNKVEPYDPEVSQERAELFMDLPIDCIKSANSFFLQSANLSIKNTMDFLVNHPQMEMMPQEDQDNLRSLAQQGLGGIQSTVFLEKILSDLQKLPSYQSGRRLTGLRGRKTSLLSKIWRSKKQKV